MIYFSPNTPRSQWTQLSSILRMCIVESMDNYLWFPLLIGKNKTNAFRHIIDKLSNRIKGWSKRLLSLGGKEVFVKVVLQSLPTHLLSIFLIPRGIIDTLVAEIRNFW